MDISGPTEEQQALGEQCGIPTSLYHGGMTGSITSFYWGSHFGTREQALFAILAKGVRDNHKNIPSTPYLYECKHSLRPSDVTKMNRDWGSPFHSAALLTYLKSLGRVEKQRKIWAEHDLGNPKHNDSALEFLKIEMLGDGCKALSYDNSIEGCSLSFMILNPDDIIGIDQSIPRKEELNETFNQNYHKLSSYGNEKIKRELLESILAFCPI